MSTFKQSFSSKAETLMYKNTQKFLFHRGEAGLAGKMHCF